MYQATASLRRLSRATRPVLKPLRKLRARVGLRDLELLWLEITRSCNLQCSHCYAESTPALPVVEEMQRDDWFRVLHEGRKLGCKQVQFIGGEPTVHPDLQALLVRAGNLGYWVREVYTNATLITPELVEFFARNHVMVAVSFYSADPEVHDRLTGNKGSFHRTLAGIRALVEGGIYVRAGLIRTDAEGTGIEQAKALLRDLGVTDMGTDRLRGIGRGQDHRPGSSPSEELCGQCWRGKLCVDARGNAYPCVFARFATVGNVFEQSIPQIVRGNALHSFRTDSYVR